MHNDRQRRIWGCFNYAERGRRLDYEALDELELSLPRSYTRYHARNPVHPGQRPIDTPIGLSIGWGIAYRCIFPPTIGGRNSLSIPISFTIDSEMSTIGYCSYDRYVKLSIDTYLFDL